MQRYGYDGWTGLIYPAADGDYVTHSEAKAEIDRLQAEVDRLTNAKAAPAVQYWRNKAASARNEAMDEAAELVNSLAGHDHTIRWSVDEIRALKK